MTDFKTQFSQRDFAIGMGLSHVVIGRAVKSAKLVLTDGKIDIENKANIFWIREQATKGREFNYQNIINKKLKPVQKPKPKKAKTPLPRKPKAKQPVTPAPTPLPPVPTEDDPQMQKYEEAASLAEEKIKAEIAYKQQQVATQKLQYEKISGRLMPTDAVQTLFNYSVETMRATYLQESRGLAEIYRQRMKLSHGEFVKLQKDLAEKVNSFVNVFKNNLMSGLDGIVADYEQVRGRGEKK